MYSRNVLVLFLKMLLIFIVGKLAYLRYNNLEIDFINEVVTATYFLIILIFIYVIATIIPPKTKKDSTEEIINDVKMKLNYPHYHIFNDYNGVYQLKEAKSVDGNHFMIYTAVNDPRKIVISINTLVGVLSILDTKESRELLNYCEILIPQLEYMASNPNETYQEIKEKLVN